MSLTSQKEAEILTTLQGAYAEGVWNKEKLEAIVAEGGEAGAIAQSILAKKAENIENTKGIASSKALTASLKEQLATRLSLLASNPVAWIVGITAACVGLVAIQKKLSKSLKECKEDLDKYNSNFETSQSEVESLTTEIKTCTDRLSELKKLANNGTISIIEQEEYERLQKTNDELERNLKIEQEKASLNAIEGAKTADQTIGKEFQSNYLKETVYDGSGVSYEDRAYVNPQEELEASISEYNRLKDEIESLNKSFDNGDIKQDEYTKKLNELTNAQTKARTRASEMSDILVECEQAYTNLNNTGSTFTTSQTKNYESVKNVNQEYSDFLDTINGVNDSFENLDVTEKKQAAKNKYASGDKDISEWIDSLNEDQLNIVASSKFAQALEERKQLIIDEQSDMMDHATLSAKNYADVLTDVLQVQANLSDETPILSFTQAISQVQELSKGFDQLDKIYADVLNKEDFDWSSILNNTSFTEAFGKTENVTEEYKAAYDDFIKTISNSPDDINKCQDAFNNLATEYVNDSGALKNLTEENKQATITMLEQMGVANAEEVVTATLAHNKQELTLQNILLANSTMDLSTVTADEIQRLLDEGVITQEVAKQLAAYAAEKQYTNNKVINTVSDCNNLIALMKTAEGTTEAVAKLEKLKARLYNDNGTAKVISNEERKNVERAINNIAAEFNAKVSETIKIPQMTYNGGSSTQKVRDDLSKAAESVADSAKKTAEDLYNDLKEQIDAYMDYMEKSLDAGKIDYNTYCNSVRNYLDDLYHSGKLKAEDYFSYIEKMLNKQKAIFDKVISAVVDRIEKEVDAIQEQIDAIEKQNDALNEQKDNYDKILSVVSDVYDKQIEELNNQKQALQDQIDALNDTNDALDLQYRKEQALYALENAQRARNKKIYIEGKGYVYTQDYEDIKSKQKDLSDIKNEEIIDKLKKEQDAIDDSIEILNKYKELWADISKAYEEETNKQLAIAILGKNYEKVILQNRMSDITNFKNKYVAVQKQIDDNTNLINSYNEKVDYYNKLKEQWQSITDEYDKQRNAQYASQVLGANWENDVLNGRLSTWDNFRNQYVSLQQAIADAQVQSANAQMKALQALADAAQASANAQIEAAQRVRREKIDNSSHSIGDAVNIDGMISAGAPTSVINKITGNKSNTSAAATADQRKNNSNIIMSNEQKMTIAASKSSFTNSDADKRKLFHNIRMAKGGVVEIDPDDLLTDIAKQHGEDGFIMARNGERVLTPNQNASFEKFVDLITGMNITPQMFMPDFTRFATGNSTDNSSVIVNIGDINLQGVQNAEQLGDAIIKRLPGYITQRFNNK